MYKARKCVRVKVWQAKGFCASNAMRKVYGKFQRRRRMQSTASLHSASKSVAKVQVLWYGERQKMAQSSIKYFHGVETILILQDLLLVRNLPTK
jgi:hypothetical protein